jgi:hypothetical protein
MKLEEEVKQKRSLRMRRRRRREEEKKRRREGERKRVRQVGGRGYLYDLQSGDRSVV